VALCCHISGDDEQVADASNSNETHQPYAVLKIRDFRLYIFSMFLVVVGGQINSLAVGYELYKRTGSELALAWIGAALVTPMLIFTLPAGQLADWMDRRRLMICTLLLSMCCSAGLYFCSRLQWSDQWIYLFLVLRGTAGTFGRPARSALLPQIVGPEDFNSAVTWNSSFFHMAAVGGPAIGGLILAYDIPLAYMIDGVLIFSGCAMLFMMHVRHAPKERTPATLENLVAGMRFVWKTKVILAALTLDLFAVLLGGAVYLLPVFAVKILHVNATGLGWLRSAQPMGALGMAILLAHLPPMRRAGPSMLIAVAGFGVATIVFGYSTNFWLSMAMLFMTGALDSISVVVRHTLVQTLAPDAMRGRVAAVNGLFIGASNELGGVESGVVAKYFGPVFSVVSGGIGTLLVVVGVAGLWPQILKIGSLRDLKPEPVSSAADAAMIPEVSAETEKK